MTKAQAAQTGETAIVAKLTVATMKFNPGRAKSEEKKVFLGRVMGVAEGLKTVTAANGDVHTAIAGNFLGTNAATRQDYRSGVLYLPSGIHDLVQNAVDAGLDDNGKPQFTAVEFGFDLYAVPAGTPAGYSYEANPVIQAQESDPMAELRAKMDAAKALPAS